MTNSTERQTFTLYTDGACLGNPGPGGWAYILRSEDGDTECSGGDPATTNQRMEVTAVMRALESLATPANVIIYADSQYVTKGLVEWMDGWIARGWKNTAKKAVANQDLWRILAELRKKHTLTTQWVKGHDGHAENERCDEMASLEAAKF